MKVGWLLVFYFKVRLCLVQGSSAMFGHHRKVRPKGNKNSLMFKCGSFMLAGHFDGKRF